MLPLRRDAEVHHTASVEDYLKAIFALSRATKAASTSEIARRLHVAPPSVTGMVHHLAEQGLLAYEPYRGVRLTLSGKRIARRVVWRHRVIKTYLMRELQCPWVLAEAEADRLEHAVGDELVNRMAATLAEPAVAAHRGGSLVRTEATGRRK